MANQGFQHWRDLTDLTHLRAETFAPKEKKVLTIKEIKRETLKNSQGAVSEKPVAYFEEDVLPMVLNVTNCKTIETLYKTGNIYEWVGKKIQVYATNTRVAGENVPCLRIEKVIPTTNEPIYYCSVCGKVIDKKIHDGSIKKYGKAYCSADCIDAEANGEKLL